MRPVWLAPSERWAASWRVSGSAPAPQTCRVPRVHSPVDGRLGPFPCWLLRTFANTFLFGSLCSVSAGLDLGVGLPGHVVARRGTPS